MAAENEGAFYEDARQEALTDSLGQVHCSAAIHGDERKWHWFLMGKPCKRCRAEL